MEEIYYIAQWRGTDGRWHESAGFGTNGDNQQLHYAEEAGIENPHSREGAAEFVRVLKTAFLAENVRVVRRVETVIY